MEDFVRQLIIQKEIKVWDMGLKWLKLGSVEASKMA